MKILFLEDDQNRIAKARREFVGDALTVVETAQEAIAALDSGNFDLASLDHDLGGTVMAESDENSGYAVAKHIATMEQQPFVIVHSFNPVGANRMMLHLVELAPCARALWDTSEYWRVVDSLRHEVEAVQ